MDLSLHRSVGTFRQLQILMTVAETGSVSAAAESLALSQPTVSMQLKKLADTVGLPLYEHVGGRFVPTEAGSAVLGAAREIASQFEGLHQTLTDLRGLKAGTLRIGIVTTAKYFVPHLLGEFAQRYPDIDIDMKVSNREMTIERLTSGLDDCAMFSHPPDDDTIESFRFLPNPLVAIAPVDHPLTERGYISLAEFAESPFLIRERGSGTRRTIEALFEECNIKPNIRMTIDSGEAIKHAVMSGLGTSIVSSYTLAYGGHHGVEELQVEHLPLLSHWYFARLKKRRASLVANAFVDYLRTGGRDKLVGDLLKEFPNVVSESLVGSDLPDLS